MALYHLTPSHVIRGILDCQGMNRSQISQRWGVATHLIAKIQEHGEDLYQRVLERENREAHELLGGDYPPVHGVLVVLKIRDR